SSRVKCRSRSARILCLYNIKQITLNISKFCEQIVVYKCMGNSLNIGRRRTREYLTQEELAKLLASSQDSANSRNPVRDYCMLLLMFRHGLRVSVQGAGNFQTH